MLHKIKELCKEQGITLAELERRVGIASKSIFRWDERIPAVDKVIRVARILDTTVEELCKGDF